MRTAAFHLRPVCQRHGETSRSALVKVLWDNPDSSAAHLDRQPLHQELHRRLSSTRIRQAMYLQRCHPSRTGQHVFWAKVKRPRQHRTTIKKCVHSSHIIIEVRSLAPLVRPDQIRHRHLPLVWATREHHPSLSRPESLRENSCDMAWEANRLQLNNRLILCRRILMATSLRHSHSSLANLRITHITRTTVPSPAHFQHCIIVP